MPRHSFDALTLLLAGVATFASWATPTRASDGVSAIYAFSLPDLRTPLVAGQDGAYYGTTSGGGAHGFGSVFRVATDGTMTPLHDFAGPDGDSPLGALCVTREGNFYGVTERGGAANQGVVYRVTANGDFSVVHTMVDDEGFYARGGLVQGPDGVLYGTTFYGGPPAAEGAYRAGTIFRVTLSGDLTVLHAFNGIDGGYCASGLLLGGDGNFYGVTPGDGSSGESVAFRITPAGAFTTLHTFNDSSRLMGPLVLGADGKIYGATDGSVFRLALDGSVGSVFDFGDGGGVEGIDQLTTGLSVGPNGVFYGVGRSGTSGVPVVFSLTTGGVANAVHQFTATEGVTSIAAPLTCDAVGNLYGVAEHGAGARDGAVFAIAAASRQVSILHRFDDPEGATPAAGLVQGRDGFLYGVTVAGGDAGYGTVFRVGLDGTRTILHSFEGTDGGMPYGTLIQGRYDDGFYGTTSYHANGTGTVFRMMGDGTFATLHVFSPLFGSVSIPTANSEGARPIAGLLQTPKGLFYGATASGGKYGKGTLFTLGASSNYSISTIHTFTGPDGGDPETALSVSVEGLTLYGDSLLGSVFSLSLGGSSFKVLHQFNLASEQGPTARWCWGRMTRFTARPTTPCSSVCRVASSSPRETRRRRRACFASRTVTSTPSRAALAPTETTAGSSRFATAAPTNSCTSSPTATVGNPKAP